jgi:hypothetical protein
MPKGEKVLSPKQKDRTTISNQKFSQMFISIGVLKSIFNWYLISMEKFQLVFGIHFKKGKSFQKPS